VTIGKNEIKTSGEVTDGYLHKPYAAIRWCSPHQCPGAHLADSFEGHAANPYSFSEEGKSFIGRGDKRDDPVLERVRPHC